MSSLFDEPEIKTLLTAIDHLHTMLANHDKRSEAALELQTALNDIYRDFGKAVYLLQQQRSERSKEPEEPPQRFTTHFNPTLSVDPETAEIALPENTEDLPDITEIPEVTPLELDQIHTRHVGDHNRWYTDEVQSSESEPFFEASDHLEEDIPISERFANPAPPTNLGTTTDERHAYRSPQVLHPADLTSTPLFSNTHDDINSPWVAQLQQMLILLEAPQSLHAYTDLAAEASRIQWATFDLERSWSALPRAVQQALLGMLSARCRQLQTQMDVHLGPSHALSHLRAYQQREDLNPVVGLIPDRRPEYRNWLEDAEHWWDVLTKGTPSPPAP